MRHVNPNIYPVGGFFFKESDGIRIGGDTWPGVIRRVEHYRSRNGLPAGNPAEEVMNQACQRNPGICTEENAAYTHEVSRATLKSRVLLWFVRMTQARDKEPFTFSYETDARNRASVCASCPKNTFLPDGCSSCKAAVRESRKNLIGGRASDGRIEACSVLGEDLNTAAWIEQVTVENGELPGHCWRKRGV